MTTHHENLNEQLTTDALPSPSSENNKNIDNDRDQYDGSTNYKSPEIEEEIHTNNSNNTYGRKLKRKNIRKISPATASAVIINVNNSKSVHVGDTYVHHYNGLEKPKKTEIVETAAIRSLKMNNSHLTRDDLLFVASHIDYSSWKNVARDLDFSEGQISQFISEHYLSGPKEVIFQVLLDWYQNAPDEATISNLSNLLWKNDQKDVVKRWSLRKK